MRFWIQHAILLLLCVVTPLMAALYFDTQREVERASTAGAAAARIGHAGLEARLQLESHQEVNTAITTAQKVVDQELMTNLGRAGSRGADAFASIRELLDKAAPEGGFAWLIDANGSVIAESGASAPADQPRSIFGHPVFVQTQQGFALDSIWSSMEENIRRVAGAPLVQRGRASGAVLIGRPIDKGLVESLARSVEAEVTLVAGDDVLVSTMESVVAQEISEATAGAVEPRQAGRRLTPLNETSNLPFLPLFLDASASGLAYSSTNLAVAGAPPRVRWVISVPSSDGLEDVAPRQEVIMGVLFAALLLAVLIGLINHRTFVSPIERVAEHLSGLQLGRAAQELPEERVSKPFRRLVRLVNMTVQKLPTPGLSSITSPSSTDLSLSMSPPSRTMTPTPSATKTPPPPSADSGSALEALSKPRDVSKSTTPPPPPGPSLPDFNMERAASNPPAPVAALSSPPAPALDDGLADLKFDAPVSAASAKPLTPEPEMPPMAPPARTGAPDDEAAAALAFMENFGTGNANNRAGSVVPSAADFGTPEATEREAPTAESADKTAAFARPPSFHADPPQIGGGSPFDNAEPAATRGSSQVRGGGSLSVAEALGSAVADQHAPHHGGAEVEGGFNREATVVAPVAQDLLAKSAREDLTDAIISPDMHPAKADMTVVAPVSRDLLAQSRQTSGVQAGGTAAPMGNGLDAADHAHFKEVYEQFVEMRRRCGENTSDLAFDKFLGKLSRNRENLIKKYNCRTVRFQVYEKNGKAALKATPVRSK